MIKPIDKSLNQKTKTKKDIPTFQKTTAAITDIQILEKL